METESIYAAGAAVADVFGAAFTAERLARSGEYRGRHDAAEAAVALVQWHWRTARIQAARAEARGELVQAGEWRDACGACRHAVQVLRSGVDSWWRVPLRLGVRGTRHGW